MSRGRFTPVQQRMVDCLKSGAPCKRENLHKCLNDDLGDYHNIHAHLSTLRTKLKPGYEIICQTANRVLYYRIIKCIEGEDPFEEIYFE